VINGDGSYSRDFTYIDNVIRMNFLALTTTNESALNQIYNTAVGDRTTLVQLVHSLKKYLSKFDPAIANVKEMYGPNRLGDIPHSQASIDKAVKLLNYKPTHNFDSGLKNAVDWYWESFKS
jgi:UDP-N-acetylglucosamine 4-epimerase